MFRDIIAVYCENRRKTSNHTVWENGGILSVTDSGEYFYHFDLNGLYSSQGYESKFSTEIARVIVTNQGHLCASVQ